MQTLGHAVSNIQEFKIRIFDTFVFCIENIYFYVFCILKILKIYFIFALVFVLCFDTDQRAWPDGMWSERQNKLNFFLNLNFLKFYHDKFFFNSYIIFLLSHLYSIEYNNVKYCDRLPRS